MRSKANKESEPLSKDSVITRVEDHAKPFDLRRFRAFIIPRRALGYAIAARIRQQQSEIAVKIGHIQEVFLQLDNEVLPNFNTKYEHGKRKDNKQTYSYHTLDTDFKLFNSYQFLLLQRGDIHINTPYFTDATLAVSGYMLHFTKRYPTLNLFTIFDGAESDISDLDSPTIRYRIIKQLANATSPKTLTQLSQELGMDKRMIHKHLETMSRTQGVVEKVHGATYRCEAKTIAIKKDTLKEKVYDSIYALTMTARDENKFFTVHEIIEYLRVNYNVISQKEVIDGTLRQIASDKVEGFKKTSATSISISKQYVNPMRELIQIVEGSINPSDQYIADGIGYIENIFSSQELATNVAKTARLFTTQLQSNERRGIPPQHILEAPDMQKDQEAIRLATSYTTAQMRRSKSDSDTLLLAERRVISSQHVLEAIQDVREKNNQKDQETKRLVTLYATAQIRRSQAPIHNDSDTLLLAGPKTQKPDPMERKQEQDIDMNSQQMQAGKILFIGGLITVSHGRTYFIPSDSPEMQNPIVSKLIKTMNDKQKLFSIYQNLTDNESDFYVTANAPYSFLQKFGKTMQTGGQPRWQSVFTILAPYILKITPNENALLRTNYQNKIPKDFLSYSKLQFAAMEMLELSNRRELLQKGYTGQITLKAMDIADSMFTDVVSRRIAAERKFHPRTYNDLEVEQAILSKEWSILSKQILNEIKVSFIDPPPTRTFESVGLGEMKIKLEQAIVLKMVDLYPAAVEQMHRLVQRRLTEIAAYERSVDFLIQFAGSKKKYQSLRFKNWEEIEESLILFVEQKISSEDIQQINGVEKVIPLEYKKALIKAFESRISKSGNKSKNIEQEE